MDTEKLMKQLDYEIETSLYDYLSTKENKLRFFFYLHLETLISNEFKRIQLKLYMEARKTTGHLGIVHYS